jgi:hypothetical protein
MLRPRAAFLFLTAPAFLSLPLCAQTVVSTHSGVLYFFEGSVFIGDDAVQQKFGKFPEVGEGRKLRTEKGRAEMLLTPGVFLRLGENSSVSMVSNSLSDTKVELLAGSAIFEANGAAPDTADALVYKDWTIRVPQKGVYRIDSEPAQLRVYSGKVEVSTKDGPATVTANEGEVLPLTQVLVPERSTLASNDSFKNWAMGRSQAVSADNAIAADIVDDPSQMDNTGLAAGGFSYFPMTGVPSLGITNPYGLSFWSPYQSTLSSLYFPSYMYGPLNPGWPTALGFYPRSVLYPSRIGAGLRPGLHPIITPSPRIPITSPPRILPRAPAPHVGIGAHAVGGHR